MDRMAKSPTSFKEIVEADLRRAARLIVAIQDEIDPQLRFATPQGDYAIALTLPREALARDAMLRRVSTFMVWKQVRAFTMAVETYQPDAVYCVGIATTERINCLARIAREPRPWTARNFGAVEWLPEASIDPVLVDLLPRVPRAVTPREISALEEWFGASGRFPAVHVDSNEVRGLT